MFNRDEEYILRIINYCIRISDAKNRFGDRYEKFIKDYDYQDVINMNLFQIGEITNKVSDSFKNSHSDIPWHQIYGIRNIIAHTYVAVDNKTVWDTINEDIPNLKEKLEKILN